MRSIEAGLRLGELFNLSAPDGHILDNKEFIKHGFEANISVDIINKIISHRRKKGAGLGWIKIESRCIRCDGLGKVRV